MADKIKVSGSDLENWKYYQLDNAKLGQAIFLIEPTMCRHFSGFYSYTKKEFNNLFSDSYFVERTFQEILLNMLAIGLVKPTSDEGARIVNCLKILEKRDRVESLETENV